MESLRLTEEEIPVGHKVATRPWKRLDNSLCYEEPKWLIEKTEEEKHLEDLKAIVYDLWEEEFFEEQNHPQLEDDRMEWDPTVTDDMTWEEFLKYRRDVAAEEELRASSKTITNRQADSLRKKIVSAGLSDSDAEIVAEMLKSLQETIDAQFREANEERLIKEEAARRSMRGEKVDMKVSKEIKDMIEASLRRRCPSLFNGSAAASSSSSIAALE